MEEQSYRDRGIAQVLFILLISRLCGNLTCSKSLNTVTSAGRSNLNEVEWRPDKAAYTGIKWQLIQLVFGAARKAM